MRRSAVPTKPWSNAHLFEVRGGLNLPDGLHESVPDDDADVGAGVTVRFVSELPQVGLAQAVRGVAQVEAEHLRSRWLLGQRDVDALLKPSTQHADIYPKQCWDTNDAMPSLSMSTGSGAGRYMLVVVVVIFFFLR